MIFGRPSSVSFPAGINPGFNPNHPASKGISYGYGFSAVALGNGGALTNLLNAGKPSTITGATTSAVLGGIGKCVGFPGSGANLNNKFAGNSTVIDTNATIAVVAQIDSINAATSCFFTNTSVNTSGLFLGYSSTGAVFVVGGSANATSTITLTAGVPYFIAFSNGPSAYFVVKRLDTGAVQSQTVTKANPGATAVDGIYAIGGTPGNSGRSLNGKVAAAMYAPQTCTMQTLLQWAEDPWAFWYPDAAADAPALGVFQELLAASAAVFNQTVNVASTTATSVSKAVSKIASVASTSATSSLKSVSKAASILSTSATSFLKAISKTITLSSVTATIVSAFKGGGTVFNQTVSVAATTTTAAVKKAVGKLVNVSSTSATSSFKSVSKTVAVLSTSTTSFLKSVSKLVSLASASTTSVAARKLLVFTQTITAHVTTSTLWTAIKSTFSAITKATQLRSYLPNPYPTLGSDPLYILAELKKISAVIQQHIEATKSIDTRLTNGGL